MRAAVPCPMDPKAPSRVARSPYGIRPITPRPKVRAVRDPERLVRPALAALPRYRAGRNPAAQAGGRTWKLSSNENPYPPVAAVSNAIAAAGSAVNRYPDLVSADLTEALAARLGVDVDRVALGTGSVGLLGQIMQASVEPGDEVVMAWRSFEAYPIAAGVAGARMVQVPLGPGARHDLSAMAAAVGDRTRVVLVCTPNNPTGPAVHHDEMRRFLDTVAGRAIVVIDEAYAEFVRDPEAADALRLADEWDNVVVLRTFSKAYGLAGLRVGYAVAHPAVASALRLTLTLFGVSTLAQVAAVAALGAAAEFRVQHEAIVEERSRVCDALLAQGWDVPDAQGNFVWLPLGNAATDFASACETRGVSVRAFAGDGVRISVGEPEALDVVLDVTADPRWEGHRGPTA